MSILIKGEVMRIIFANSDNNYRIFVIGDESGNSFTLNGYIVKLDEGLTYEFECEEVNIMFNGDIKPIILKNIDSDDLIQLILPIRTY